MNPAQYNSHIVVAQKIDNLPAVAAPDDDRRHTKRLSHQHGLLHIARQVGMNIQAAAAVKQRAAGCKLEVSRLRSRLLAVGFRLLKETAYSGYLLVITLIFGDCLRTPVEPVAARPVEMLPVVGQHSRILPVPCIQLYNARVACQHTTIRSYLRCQYTTCAHCRNHPGVSIVGNQ